MSKSASAAPDADDPERSTQGASWQRSLQQRPGRVMLVGNVLLWLAFPPVGWWPLACIGVGLLAYAAVHAPEKSRWLGFKAYGGGFVFWMLLLEGIRRPHWASNFGWVLLAGYLAVYSLMFYWLLRSGTRRLGLPLVLVCPVVVVALELLRGYAISGFSIGLLGHVLYQVPIAIQIADLAGAYLVSFWLALIAASLVSFLVFRPGELFGWRSLYPAFIAVGLSCFALGYGWVQLTGNAGLAEKTNSQDDDSNSLKVVLIQGSYPSDLNFDQSRRDATFLECQQLSEKAFQAEPDTDLIVWPESLFLWRMYDIVILDDDPQTELDEDLLRKRQAVAAFQGLAVHTSEQIRGDDESGPALLVGIETVTLQQSGAAMQRYNTAMLIDPSGNPADRYYKIHRVIAGEYLPLGDQFPWLYQIVPIATGIQAGEEAKAMDVAGCRIAPIICFESVVPHFIRQQVNTLEKEGEPIGAIVCLTNDGWFHLSAMLELHFACNVFRAVETGKPVVVAANTGITGGVDARGRVFEKLPRGVPAYAVVEIPKSSPARQQTIYRQIGDLFAFLCLASTLLMLIVEKLGFGSRR